MTGDWSISQTQAEKVGPIVPQEEMSNRILFIIISFVNKYMKIECQEDGARQLNSWPLNRWPLNSANQQEKRHQGVTDAQEVPHEHKKELYCAGD